MDHERSEWLRIISNLTATNEKLVNAYNYTLKRLENVTFGGYSSAMKKRDLPRCPGRTQKWREKRWTIHQRKDLRPGKLARMNKKAGSKKDWKNFQTQILKAILKLSEGLEDQKKIVHDLREDCKLFKNQDVTVVDTFRLENSDVFQRISTLEKELNELQRRVQIVSQTDEKVVSIEPEPLLTINQTEVTESDPLEPDERISKLVDFKKELLNKRELRKQALDVISREMKTLRQELQTEKEAHAETSRILENLKEAKVESQDSEDKFDCNPRTEEFEAIRISDSLKISNEIMNNLRFELEKMDDLRYQLGNDAEAHKSEIDELRKQGEELRLHLRCRENQIGELKDRLALILVKFEDTTFLDTDDELKLESRHQIDDLGRFRRLHQVRCATLEELNESVVADLNQTKGTLVNVRENQDEIEEELRKAKHKVSVQDGEILNLESQLGLAKADCRDLQGQISIINTLFTQILLSGLSPELDLDHLTKLLQENHDLIRDMTNGNNAEALPKLLLDLIEQVDGRSEVQNEIKEENEIDKENIAHNLPKVWRILMELLSCYEVKTPIVSSDFSATDSCYKSVDTPSGPRLVISVSKTYIRLKELILEKKQLEKEMNKMKRLNFHLENKLLKQEQRLSTVSDELSKTWTIVDRMQAQHQQLHTHEKILRYELQQKRKMLQELKQELEYCREKWESARQKNTNTELEWRSLQQEFVARKTKFNHADPLNSPESGFGDSQDEEDETKKLNVGKLMNLVKNKRKKLLDDESQASSCDVDSEAQQDEASAEPKESSSDTAEPQEEALEEDIDSSLIDEIKAITCCPSEQPDISSSADSNDPLDKALTNVIRNLIKLDTTSYTNYEETDKETVPVSSEESIIESDDVPNRSATSEKSDTEAAAEEATPTDRAARLKHLEEQAEWLLKKMSATNRRGSALSNKLEELHEVYGHVPTPPELPDVLPVFKIPTQPDLHIVEGTSQESQTSNND